MALSRRSFLEAGAATALPAGDRISVGMIGAGARAHELMEAIKQHSDARIVAVVDAYRGRVERAMERTGARSVEGTDAAVAHFGHFFASIRSRQPYWEDAAAGHHAAACAHMVNLSCERRQMVEWDSARDDIRAL